MSTSPTAAAAVKKSATKTDSETTKRRIVPTRIKGWLEQAAGAFGITAASRNLSLSGLPKVTIKKKNEDGSMIMVSKPTSVIATGVVVEQDDDRLIIRVADENIGIFEEVATDFTSQLALNENLEGKSENGILYNTHMLRLKPKHFKGRYTQRYVKGERDTEGKFENLTGKRVDVIVRFYGLYKLDDIYGPLVSVSAYNVLE